MQEGMSLGLDGMALQLQLDFIWALMAAVLLGGILGLERSLAGKQAGMRTYALVSLGSALFTVTGTLASLQLSFFGGINPLQVAGSIVIGIGFIGAGIATARSEHAEITTAAGILVAAGLGMACGFGLYWIAAAATIFGVLVFSYSQRIEHYFRTKYGTNIEQ